MIDRIISYVVHALRIQKRFTFRNSDIIAMDETAFWKDMVSDITVEVTRLREVPMKPTGYDKVCVSVCLTGKANPSKCKPFIAFKEAKRVINFFIKKLYENVLWLPPPTDG